MRVFLFCATLLMASSAGAVSTIDFTDKSNLTIDSSLMVADRDMELKKIKSSESTFKGALQETPKKMGEAFRKTTLSQMAESYAMQAGLKFRYEQIVKLIESDSIPNLNILNFNLFIQDEVILMPSFQVIKDFTKLEDSNLYKVNVIYKVDQEARIVSHVPTYHDYLIYHFDDPVKIHDALKPKNSVERSIFEKAINKGWEKGVEQANEIFSDGVRRLVRDITGRITYLELLKNNVVKAPVLNKSKTAVNYVDREQRIGQIVYEIQQVVEYNNIDQVRAGWVKGASSDH